jgi:hypothetical protein
MIIVEPSCLKDADGARTRSDQYIMCVVAEDSGCSFITIWKQINLKLKCIYIYIIEVSNQLSYHIIAVLKVSYSHRDTTIILSYKITTEYKHTMSFITGPGLRLITKT